MVIIFYALLLGIVMIPILMILPALSNKRKIIETNRAAENVTIARQRMQEIKQLKTQRETNIEDAQLELQAALLEDLLEHQIEYKQATAAEQSPSTSTIVFKGWGVLIVVLIPLLSLSLYSYLGSPQFAVHTIDDIELDKQLSNEFDIEQLLLQLEAKLEQDPENPKSWALAARTYMTLGDYQKAESAYAKLNALVLGNPDFLAGWADAEIMRTGNIYTPTVKDRIGKALALNPNHITALWIASLGTESLGEHDKALAYLNTLLPLVTDDKQSVNKIKRLIERNRNSANVDSNTQKQPLTKQAIHARGKVITVEVMLADNLVARADKDDLVFVFAKALEGPRAPLAVSKHRVKDLPIVIELTENMAMLPSMTIASFDKITVSARVSKTGKPIQQPGDLVSDSALITKESQKNTAKLIIDRIAE